MVEVHIIISGKHRDISNYEKQIHYPNNPWREEPRKCYHQIQTFHRKTGQGYKRILVLSASSLCFIKSTTTISPPTQVVNSDNGLILAFNNSPTKMTGDKNMPLVRIISTTCSGNYNSAHGAVLEASFFLLPFLIFSLFFFLEKLNFEYVSKR